MHLFHTEGRPFFITDYYSWLFQSVLTVMLGVEEFNQPINFKPSRDNVNERFLSEGFSEELGP